MCGSNFFESDVTFDSFLAGFGRNRVYGGTCCSTQTAYKYVLTSSANQKTGPKGQIVSEFLLMSQIFQKTNKKIYQISGQEAKKWSNVKVS